MKIAFLLPGLEAYGGVRVTVGLANGLSETGHDVTVVAVKRTSDEVPYFPISRNVKVIHQLQPVIRPYLLQLLLDTRLLKASITASDIIIATFYNTFFAAQASSRGKVVLFAQGYDPESFSKPQDFMAKNIANRCLKKAPEIIGVSKYVANKIKTNCDNDVRWVVNPFVANEFFLPKNGIVKDPAYKNILFIGSWKSRVKGGRDLIRALKIMRERNNIKFKLTIVSRDQEVPMVSFPVEIISPRPDEMPSIYDKSDILVQPSWHEGFALPPLEAMVRKVPVLLTDSGGVSEYAQHNVNCILVPARNPQILSDSLAQTLTDQDLARNIISGGLATGQRYTFSDTLREFEQTLKEICGSL